MKKHLCLLFAVLLLLSAYLFAIPAGAQENYAELTYSIDPAVEGEAPESGRVLPDQVFAKTPTIRYDPAKTKLSVNGTPCTDGSVRLACAGEYKLTVTSVKDSEADPYTYSVSVLPELSFFNKQIFTSYPTVTCPNALRLVLNEGQLGNKEKEIESGYVIKELGRHTVTVYGCAERGVTKATFELYVRAVDVKRVFDTATGKQALQVTVGSFPEHTVEAVLDGRALQEGANIVTRVGTHDLSANFDGVPLMKNNGFSLPSAEELTLRVELALATLDADEPFYLYLEEWDADFRLDGKAVTGDIRVTDQGKHTLAVMGANEVELKGMFVLYLETEQEPLSLDRVSFTFTNPHFTYVYLVAVPAVLLLIAAAIFLIKRRSIL